MGMACEDEEGGLECTVVHGSGWDWCERNFGIEKKKKSNII